MSDAKHTPGPWYVDYLDKAGQRVVRAEHIEVATCWHHSVESIEKEMEANARLIAAAPDMYEALRQVEAEMKAGLGSSYGETREQIRRALSKADGRS